MIIERISFDEATGEPLLLKTAFDKLSGPQQVALKAVYGLPLNDDELKWWAILQGHSTFDDLGYPLVIDEWPYEPMEYEETYAILGRRSAKTSNFLSFIIVYEALLGGHTRYASPKQEVRSFFVAQKLDLAQAVLRDFIEPLISSSPLGAKEIEKDNIAGIKLKNGHMIAPAPPAIKNFRGFAIPICCLDESAFYYRDAEAANPDYEVIRSVEPAQGQFPYRKLIAASTPWSKEGIIFEAANAGTDGILLPSDDDRKARFRNVLVMRAPTAAMQNPLFKDRKWFARQRKKDPEAFDREYLVKFTDAATGMFGESLLRQAMEGAPPRREPQTDKGFFYVAALDPAFRGDDFAFAIGHYEPEQGYVQDLLKKWNPRESKLDPALILDEIKLDLDAYQCEAVYSDQFQLESLQKLAEDRNFSIIGHDFTASSKARVFGSFLQLLRNGRVKLLRNYELLQQLMWMQKTVGHGGYIRISAPSGKHDDLVTVTVLGCAMSIRFEPERPRKTTPEVETLYDRIMKPKPVQDGDEYL